MIALCHVLRPEAGEVHVNRGLGESNHLIEIVDGGLVDYILPGDGFLATFALFINAGVERTPIKIPVSISTGDEHVLDIFVNNVVFKSLQDFEVLVPEELSELCRQFVIVGVLKIETGKPAEVYMALGG